jgi:hypothetical protein
MSALVESYCSLLTLNTGAVFVVVSDDTSLTRSIWAEINLRLLI